MKDDKLMMLANVASWLLGKENPLKQISKKRNFASLAIGDSFANGVLGSVSVENKPSPNDGNGKSPQKKRGSMVRTSESLPMIRPQNPPMDGLADRIRAAGGEELCLAVEKELTVTDVSSYHGRLSMPNASLRSTFLRGNEAARVRGRNGLLVTVVDEGGREYNLKLRQWKVGKGPIFNLNRDWNSVVANNSLSPKDLVQLWSFRRDSRLCFAIVKPGDQIFE